MSLQPSNKDDVDRSTHSPFLLRLFWRQNRSLDCHEFSVAPPADLTGISDYSQLLPSSIRQQSVQIYTWSSCTLGELTGLLTSVLPAGVLPSPAVGTRLVFKLIFPDTRAQIGDSGRGKWIDKPLGSVVIGGRNAELADEGMGGQDLRDGLEGDAEKALSDARYVIGDYVACSIYPPGSDGRVPPMPSYGSRPPPGRGFDGPPPRQNGFGGGRGGGGGGFGGGYRGGYGGRGGFGAPPPPGDWRRGERPPGGGYGRGGRGGRPY